MKEISLSVDSSNANNLNFTAPHMHDLFHRSIDMIYLTHLDVI